MTTVAVSLLCNSVKGSGRSENKQYLSFLVYGESAEDFDVEFSSWLLLPRHRHDPICMFLEALLFFSLPKLLLVCPKSLGRRYSMTWDAMPSVSRSYSSGCGISTRMKVMVG